MRTALTMMMLFSIGTPAVAVAQSGQASSPTDTRPNLEYEMLTDRVLGAVPHTQILFFKCWEPRDGISPPDAQTLKRIAPPGSSGEDTPTSTGNLG